MLDKIPVEDLQAINTLNEVTWGWTLKGDRERGESKVIRFTIFGVNPKNTLWFTVDGLTITEAVDKFIKHLDV